MQDRSRLGRIAKLRPGRELPFIRDHFETAGSLRLRLHTACKEVTERTGAQFRIMMRSSNSYIVRRLAEPRKLTDATLPAVAYRAGRETRTWLAETRMAGLGGYQRETRILRARACMRRVAHATGETMHEVVARLALTDREIAVLREDPFLDEFGELKDA